MKENFSKIQNRQIIELLRIRHSSPEWATFVELRDGTGMRFNHSIDFYAYNLWPSKDYLKIAYEIKISRSDFSKELNNPRKRESAESYSNECYFATQVGLVQTDEIPEGWGLIELISNGLRIKKRARQRKVESLPLSFVASLARQSTLPAPSLPNITWLLAGRELNENQLLNAANISMAKIKSELREDVIADFKASGEWANSRAYQRIIVKHLGSPFAYNLDKLDEWFSKSQAAKLTLNTQQIRMFQNLQKYINQVLALSNEEKE